MSDLTTHFSVAKPAPRGRVIKEGKTVAPICMVVNYLKIAPRGVQSLSAHRAVAELQAQDRKRNGRQMVRGDGNPAAGAARTINFFNWPSQVVLAIGKALP